jgi:tRNA A-37 threonylcarbamoyl transferase component Bud32
MSEHLNTAGLHIETRNTIQTDYGNLLTEAGLKFTTNDFFHIVGEAPANPVWRLHLTMVLPDVVNVLVKVLPMLKKYSVTFNVAKNPEIADSILRGAYGIVDFAKVLTVYPLSDKQAVNIAKELVALTSFAEGLEIPTAVPLSKLVYAEYIGSETWKPAMWPFQAPLPKSLKKVDQILHNRYKVTQTLAESVKGSVYKAYYLKRFFLIGICVVKQGRKNVLKDQQRRDISDRLRWQFFLQKELHQILPVPKPIEVFQEEDHFYLTMQFVKGITLEKVIKNLHSQSTWQAVQKENKLKLLGYLEQILHHVETMHGLGLIHRDLSPLNFMVSEKNKIIMIDLEMVYSLKKGFPDPPFEGGTAGFCSIEQYQNLIPTVKEDIFGLGGLMTWILTGHMPEGYDYKNPEHLQLQLDPIIGQYELIRLIVSCYDLDPKQRPTLNQIITIVKDYYNRLQKS